MKKKRKRTSALLLGKDMEILKSTFSRENESKPETSLYGTYFI